MVNTMTSFIELMKASTTKVGVALSPNGLFVVANYRLEY